MTYNFLSKYKFDNITIYKGAAIKYFYVDIPKDIYLFDPDCLYLKIIFHDHSLEKLNKCLFFRFIYTKTKDRLVFSLPENYKNPDISGELLFFVATD